MAVGVVAVGGVDGLGGVDDLAGGAVAVVEEVLGGAGRAGGVALGDDVVADGVGPLRGSGLLQEDLGVAGSFAWPRGLARHRNCQKDILVK